MFFQTSQSPPKDDVLEFKDVERHIKSLPVTRQAREMIMKQGMIRNLIDAGYVMRTLLKQRYLFEIYKEFGKNIIVSSDKKKDFLTQGIGFETATLPKKFSNSEPLTFIDECIIDVRNISGKTLVCRYNDELLFDFTREHGLIIVYTDLYTANAYTQLTNLIKRYKKLLEAEKVRIDFMIAVDNGRREDYYIKAVDLFTKKRNRRYEIHDNYINLHIKILTEKLNVPVEDTRELPHKIREKYSMVQELTDEDFTDIPVREIRHDGIKAVARLANDIICSPVRKEEKVRQITDLFRKLYKLYAAGKLVKGSEFDMKIYRIGHQFSVV